MKRDKKIQERVLKRIQTAKDWAKYEEFGTYPDGSEAINAAERTDDEVYNIELMVSDGLLRKNVVSDAPWLGNCPDDPHAESYLALTSYGHDVLDDSSWSLWFLNNVRSNIPTILVTIVIVILSAWAVNILGPR